MKRASTFNSQLFIGVVPFDGFPAVSAGPGFWFEVLQRCGYDSPRRFLWTMFLVVVPVWVYFLCILFVKHPRHPSFCTRQPGWAPLVWLQSKGCFVFLSWVLILPELMLKFVALKISQIHLNNCTEFAWGLTLCFDLLCWMSFFLLNPLTFRWISRGSFGCHSFVDGPDQVRACGTHRSMGSQLAEAGWGMMFQPKQSKKSKGKSNLFWGGCVFN